MASVGENISVQYNMKLSSPIPFSEQVSELTRLFLQWNECEQTVVLYALLRRIPAVQARFLAGAVQHTLYSVTELNAQESNANNPVFIEGLRNESTEIALQELLTHLPLLKVGNTECKEAYLKAIPELVNHCVSTGQNTHQAQQLLSYTLIHPAITSQDRRSLSQFLRHLEERIRNTPVLLNDAAEDVAQQFLTPAQRWDNAWPRRLNDMFNVHLGTSSFGVTLPPNPQSQPPLQPISRQRRSNSLTPPASTSATSHHHEFVDRTNGASSSSRNKPRSFSVSGEHTSFVGIGPLSPQGSCASSGSEGRLEDASNRSLASGMRDVPTWLKSLRLHKYSSLFAPLSYEDMLTLTEEQLANQGVTKGARHKLAVSICKLKQRYNTLLKLEQDLLQTNSAQAANSFTQGSALFASTVDELRIILTTPMKPSQENDLQDIPTQFIKVLGKLCSRLVLESVDDTVLCNCVTVLDKVLQHDCFAPSQKEKVQQWRNRLGNPRQIRWQYCTNNRRQYNSQQQNRRPAPNANNVYNNHNNTHNNHSYMVGPYRNGMNGINSLYYQNLNLSHVRPAPSIEKRPSLQENSLQQVQRSFCRTNSAPKDDFMSPGTSGTAGTSGNESTPSANRQTTDTEYPNLEYLCWRMTEQAIGNLS